MTVRLKERELAAVGISAAAGCKPCTVHHVAAARKARASDEEIRRAVADALRMRRSATQIIADHALSQLGGRAHDRAPGRGGETDRIAELVCVGAAFGVNCVSNLAKHIARRRERGHFPSGGRRDRKARRFHQAAGGLSRGTHGRHDRGGERGRRSRRVDGCVQYGVGRRLTLPTPVGCARVSIVRHGRSLRSAPSRSSIGAACAENGDRMIGSILRGGS